MRRAGYWADILLGNNHQFCHFLSPSLEKGFTSFLQKKRKQIQTDFTLYRKCFTFESNYSPLNFEIFHFLVHLKHIPQQAAEKTISVLTSTSIPTYVIVQNQGWARAYWNIYEHFKPPFLKNKPEKYNCIKYTKCIMKKGNFNVPAGRIWPPGRTLPAHF